MRKYLPREDERRQELSRLIELAELEEKRHRETPLQRGGIAASAVREQAIKRWKKELQGLMS